MVKMRPIFQVKQYYGIPTPNSTPYDKKNYPLDAAGLANCYKTVGAMGVHQEPEEVKNKGVLPWWTMLVGGVAVVVLVALVISVLPQMAAAHVGKGFAKALKTEPATSGAPATSAAPVPGARQARGPGVDVAGGEAHPPEAVLEYSGYAAEGGELRACVVGEGWVRAVAVGARGMLILDDGRKVFPRKRVPIQPMAEEKTDTRK